MFIPEYTITPKSLKNISTIEYAKAIIEHTAVLPSWENQLRKETAARIISGSLKSLGININPKEVKSAIDGVSSPSSQILNVMEGINSCEKLSKDGEVTEEDLKEINKSLTRNGIYRSKKLPGKVDPEEILAETVQLFDWVGGLDAKDTHPIITAAIIRGALELVSPFENLNEITANLVIYLFLKTSGYSLKDFISLESYFNNTKQEYEQLISSLDRKEPDFTEWIDYFTEGLASEISTVSQKVKLLAKDTKVAKATGRVNVSRRQEKIVEYLQDYGVLQNKDFSILFPDKSEDTVLRDLKKLIDMEVIQKIGSTKSSRYQLK